MSHSALTVGLRQLRHKLASQQLNEDSDESLLHAFAVRREDSAFAVLVRRHGPMVLHVCRRVLGHEQDAEDAFQATFLVLARSAASLRKKASLASFLHGTAYRLALSAKRSAARRRKHENRVPSRASVDPMEELSWREVRAFLDEEIARLPEKYRSVFVVCILENLSRAEAAQRLGLTERTVLSRLFKARKRLGQRLARRGVDLTAVLGAIALATQPASALSPMLTAATIRAALATASGEGLAGMVSASVVELAQGTTTAVMMSKAKMATALLLIAALAAGAGAWTCRMTATPLPAESQEQPQVPARSAQSRSDKPQQENRNEVTVSGRVVDPDGKPVSGAKLIFLYRSGRNIPKKVWATSSAEGRFTFAVPVKEVERNGYIVSFSEMPWGDTHVLAVADGYGFAVARVGKPGATDLTLRLVKDDAPIRGRILDLQGKPVAGVQVRVNDSLYAPEMGDLSTWLGFLKGGSLDPNTIWYSYLTELSSPAFEVLFPPVTTGADGRFCIQGIGRERVADLRIDGPTIATQVIHVMTRRRETLHVPEDKSNPKKGTLTCFGADFDVAAAPTRPVVGVVRDKDTGKPLPGVTIETETIAHHFGHGWIRTTTDKNGRYRLVGLPKSSGNKIVARTYDTFMPRRIEVSNELPYLASIKEVGNPLGLEPVTVDFALKRGVWVKGRVTEKETGKPLFAARIEYFCFVETTGSKEAAGLYPFNMRHTEEDGSYRIAALPGRGLITVRAAQDHYIMGIGAERIQRSDENKKGDFFSTQPYFAIPVNYHALVEILARSGDESFTCDVALIRGRSLKGTVLDPDGKPLDDVRVAGLRDMGYWANTGAEFTVESLQPNKPRLLQFKHEVRRLSGSLSLSGNEKGPLSIRLQPWGTLTGRLITTQGEPLDGARVSCGALSVQTGKDGRFRIEGLAAGLKYDLFITKGFYVRHIEGSEPKGLTIKAGETKDLGELKIKPVE
jgi:RNA polymerase sigma factor (sigma-70 family)